MLRTRGAGNGRGESNAARTECFVQNTMGKAIRSRRLKSLRDRTVSVADVSNIFHR
jgi:hypothetical protein